MDERKAELFRRALEEGIVQDPQWIERLDEPIPLWVVLELLLTLKKQLDPPYFTYY